MATAQPESSLSEGTPVRITAPSVGKRPLVGTLVGIENDTLKLDMEGALEGPLVSVGPVPGGGVGFSIQIPVGRSR